MDGKSKIAETGLNQDREQPNDSGDEKKLPYPVRIWRYQAERFPLHQHGLLITAFTFSAASFSRICRGGQGFIPLPQFLIGVVTAILFFLLLRIADEFKDFSEDSRFRPYRAVPRGLVSLRELAVLAGVIIAVQIALNAVFMPRMLAPYFLALLYLGIMSKEFFVSAWLKKHPIVYMLSHMFIMPMIDIYTTGLDWVNARVNPPAGLMLFLVISFSNGIVIEMGRKIRAKEAEENGVETYSALLGETRATVIWICVVAVSFAIAVGASSISGTARLGIPLLSLCLLAGLFPAMRFMRKKIQAHAKQIETAAGIWTLGMYLILGATPMAVSLLKKMIQ